MTKEIQNTPPLTSLVTNIDFVQNHLQNYLVWILSYNKFHIWYKVVKIYVIHWSSIISIDMLLNIIELAKLLIKIVLSNICWSTNVAKISRMWCIDSYQVLKSIEKCGAITFDNNYVLAEFEPAKQDIFSPRTRLFFVKLSSDTTFVSWTRKLILKMI